MSALLSTYAFRILISAFHLLASFVILVHLIIYVGFIIFLCLFLSSCLFCCVLVRGTLEFHLLDTWICVFSSGLPLSVTTESVSLQDKESGRTLGVLMKLGRKAACNLM